MIVDGVIIAVLALSIFLGYKKGLIELGIKLCAVVIAIVATLILYRPITSLVINTTTLDENLEQTIIKNVPTPQSIGVGEIDEEIQNQVQSQEEAIARDLSVNIIRTGVMILLYVVIRIALRFVTALADLVAKLPILDQFNKLGGIIFGAIRGIAFIYIVLLIISFVGQITPENALNTEIQKSVIGKEMYQHNIIYVVK